MERHQDREIATCSAVVPFSRIQANPEEFVQRHIHCIRSRGLARRLRDADVHLAH